MADIVAEAEIEATLGDNLHEESEVRENDTDQGGNGHAADAEADPQAEILPAKNLHVRNLSYTTTADMLREAFSKYGEILSVNVITEPGTDNGFAFIGFTNEQEGASALAEMNGAEVDGRSIKVEESHRKKGHQKTPGRYMGPIPNQRDTRRDDDRDRSSNYNRRGGSGGFRRSNSRDKNRGGGGWAPRGGGRSRSRSPDRYRGDGGFRGDARNYRSGGGGYDRREMGRRRSPPPGDRRGGPPPPRRSRSRSRERMGGGRGYGNGRR